MPYIFRSTSSSVNRISAPSALSPGAPAGLTDGDLMILSCGCRAGGQTQSDALTGWTELYSENVALSRYIYGHIADSVNDSPAPAMTGSSKSWAFIDAFYGDVYTDLDTIVLASDEDIGTDSVNFRMPAASIPLEIGCLLYGLGTHSSLSETDNSISLTPEFTLTGDGPASGGSMVNVAGGYWIQTTATAYDGDDWTLSGNAENRTSRGAILTLRSSGAVYVNDAATIDGGEVKQTHPGAANWADALITMQDAIDTSGLSGQLYVGVENGIGAIAWRAITIGSGVVNTDILIPTGPLR